MRVRRSITQFALGLSIAFGQGCSKEVASGEAPRHHHHPPHGGAAIALGDEEYHVELVIDEVNGSAQLFVLDGELENFIRSTAPTIEITASVKGTEQSVVLAAVANPETGETVGDTSLFEGHAEWLKSVVEFNATLRSVAIRGTTFSNVKFNYPRGNDSGG